MSLDYIVVTQKAVTKSALKGFTSRYKGITVNEAPTRDAPAYELMQGERLVCSIVGPLEIDENDIPSQLLHYLADKEPLLLHQVNAPYVSFENDPNFTRDLCSFIAQCGAGAAFDQQEGDVFFISHTQRRSLITPDKKERKVDVIELTFLNSPSYTSEKLVYALLALFENVFPYALPLRYGDFEPFQGKISGHDFQPFASFWNEQLNLPFGASFNWTASPPCFGGHFGVANPRPLCPPVPSHYQKRDVLHIRIDATPLVDDFNAWNETIETLFLSVAHELNSFFAAACLKRSCTARGQNLFGSEIDHGFAIEGPGRWWAGLPRDYPSWMTWFGPHYSGLLKEHLRDTSFVKKSDSDGIFIRMSDYPMPRPDLKSIYPKLPRELLTPASIIPDLSGPG